MGWISAAIWLFILVAVAVYTIRDQDPGQKPVAAFFIFVIAFTMAATMLFSVLSWILTVTGHATLLDRPLPGLLFLLGVFGPAFLVGRWLLRKLPTRSPPIT